MNSRGLNHAYEVLSDPRRRRAYDARFGSIAPDLKPEPVETSRRDPTPGNRGFGSPVEYTDAKIPSPDPGRELNVPLGVALEWRASAVRREPQRMFTRRERRFLLVLVASCVAIILIGAVVPLTHSFDFTVEGAGLVGEYQGCLASQFFPAGARVAFSWTGSWMLAGPYSTNYTPSVVVLDPSGTILFSQQTWNGSSSFVSDRGTYQFGSLYCFDNPGVAQFHFHGQYSAPLL